MDEWEHVRKREARNKMLLKKFEEELDEESFAIISRRIKEKRKEMRYQPIHYSISAVGIMLDDYEAIHLYSPEQKKEKVKYDFGQLMIRAKQAAHELRSAHKKHDDAIQAVVDFVDANIPLFD